LGVELHTHERDSFYEVTSRKMDAVRIASMRKFCKG